MPSWNIHTAHVERLLAGQRGSELGIDDANAFLFGNLVPDVYVGFMVPDASWRIDYCITHEAKVNPIPVPDADRFWDKNIARRKPESPAGSSLALGAWAHLVTDRVYNGRFRTFWSAHNMPFDDVLREKKQSDFDLFGHSLGISSHLQNTPELLEAAHRFIPYRIAPDDVQRTIEVLDGIVAECGAASGGEAPDGTVPGTPPEAPDGTVPGNPPEAPDARYQLLSAEWLNESFDLCNDRLVSWLCAWQRLKRAGRDCRARDVREEAGLPPATPDDPDWHKRICKTHAAK